MLSLVAFLFLLPTQGRSDVVVGHFTVDSSCSERQGDKKIWAHFPADAGAYVKAVTAISARMNRCLRGINPDVADDLADYFKRVGNLRIVCAPQTAGDSSECAHVTQGSREITLTRPKDCGNLENTLFHELLHLGTRLDDMTARHHNDPSCRAYDAIYAGAEICFPSAMSLQAAGIGWYGCKAAVTSERAVARICDRLPVVISDDFQYCRPQ